MKYIDEKRMRFGYIGLFAAAVILIAAAFWDYTSNNEALMNWFISALGGLLLIAIFFFIATELILKDALDLRPQRVAVATDEAHGLMPAQHKVPTASSKADVRADSMSSAALERPMPDMRRPTADPAAGAAASSWQPHVQTAARPPSAKKEVIRIEAPKTEVEKPTLSHRIERTKKAGASIPAPVSAKGSKAQAPAAPIRIELPDSVTIDARPKEASLADVLPQSPAAVPKPTKVPAAAHGVHLQTIAYELGTSQFRVPRGAKGHKNPNAVLESTRVLCGDCGLYFRVDLDRARPMVVQCPQCSKDLGLSGARLNAEHVKMRCRFCGDFLQMPRAQEHKATQCATCGQING